MCTADNSHEEDNEGKKPESKNSSEKKPKIREGIHPDVTCQFRRPVAARCREILQRLYAARDV